MYSHFFEYFNTSTISLPTVEVATSTRLHLIERLQEDPNLVVEINSEGAQLVSISDFGAGGGGKMIISILVWEVVNIGLSLWVLSGWNFVTNIIAVLCLWLDLTSSLCTAKAFMVVIDTN